MTGRTAGRGRLYESIIDTVGDTPVVRTDRLAPAHVELYVKCESESAADRIQITEPRLRLVVIQVQKHDDENDKHHDRSRIHDDVHGKEKFCAQDEVMSAYAEKGNDEIKDAVDRIFRQHDHQRAEHCEE